MKLVLALFSKHCLGDYEVLECTILDRLLSNQKDAFSYIEVRSGNQDTWIYPPRYILVD